MGIIFLFKTSYKQLDLYKTLESGQVFRYEIMDENQYILIYRKNYVLVEKVDEGYMFHCDEDVFITVWHKYLDLDRDYEGVNQRIEEKDPRMKEVIRDNRGIRILKQDSFEMLITFIISQSKAINQIRVLVNRLARDYGELIGRYQGIELYSFPDPKSLSAIDEKSFRDMKFGYRAPYLVDAIYQINSDIINLEQLDKKGDSEVFNALLTINGVGHKVASCVMLFGFSRHHFFPIDVWMRRVMLFLYFEDSVLGQKPKIKDRVLENHGKERFGADAGIAQQYLFEYGRKNL